MIPWEEAKKFFDLNRNNFSFESKTPNSIVLTAWVCPKGHQWEEPFRQFLKSNGCKFCSGRKIVLGENDLQTLHPHIASQIHPTKNLVNVLQLSLGSNQKVWWQCEKDHEWETTLEKRVSRNTECPYCSNRKIIPGENDLQTLHPHIFSQIHPTKNIDKEYLLYSPSSGKKLWWVCSKNSQHEWEATVENRTKKDGTGCPICSNKKIVMGINDFSTTHPELKKYWDYSKNKKTNYSAHSHVKAYWKDSFNHVWERPIVTQTKNNTCPICSGRSVQAGVNDLLTTHSLLTKQWNYERNVKTPDMFSSGSETTVWWLGTCGHEWEATINNRTNGTGCPTCWGQTYQSKAEKEINNWLLTTLNTATETNVRTVIKQKEIDIYIPEKKVAVEFNGLYWHSEAAGKGKYYHHNKWKACKDKGIQLIQIWEDDWNRNPELVKRMLAHKLGATQERKVYARKAIVEPLTQLQSNEFLNKYHVQGAVDGGIRVGLFEKITVSKPFREKLVAVMVLKREPGTGGKTLNLLRYATSKNVVGGFTKLLKHVEQEFKPESIVTFSDNTVSDGGLYKKHGFKAVRELKPDYMYVVKGERVHKFNYRLKRFRDDPELQYDEGLSERELALLNNIPRIWDAGKTKWEKEFKNV